MRPRRPLPSLWARCQVAGAAGPGPGYAGRQGEAAPSPCSALLAQAHQLACVGVEGEGRLGQAPIEVPAWLW